MMTVFDLDYTAIISNLKKEDWTALGVVHLTLSDESCRCGRDSAVVFHVYSPTTTPCQTWCLVLSSSAPSFTSRPLPPTFSCFSPK